MPVADEAAAKAFVAARSELTVAVPKAEIDSVARLVADLTSGRATVKWDGPAQP